MGSRLDLTSRWPQQQQRHHGAAVKLTLRSEVNFANEILDSSHVLSSKLRQRIVAALVVCIKTKSQRTEEEALPYLHKLSIQCFLISCCCCLINKIGRGHF